MGKQLNPPSISRALIFFKASRSSVSLAWTLESKSTKVYCKIEKNNNNNGHARKFKKSNTKGRFQLFKQCITLSSHSNSEVLKVSVWTCFVYNFLHISFCITLEYCIMPIASLGSD